MSSKVEVSQQMTSNWYVRNICQGNVVPYAGFIWLERFALVNDDAHAHITYIVEHYFLEVDFQKMNVLEILKRCIRNVTQLQDTYRNLKR